MVVSEIAIDDKLCQFIRQYADDKSCLELLQFFGRYPRTRFSGLAVSHALNDRKSYTQRALKELVNKGVIRKNIENNVSLYSLTEDDSLRSLVLELNSFDWRRRQIVLRRIEASLVQ
ncbi:MAG: hypothetical protein HY665_02375 [Chloroflexi bacterium]|nr:hypothetical protein [Chloroflexota bacterium]